MSDTTGYQPDRTAYEMVLFTESLEITPADRIEVEEAETPKYLRLRTGDFRMPQAVFLVIDGERHEITLDELPSESP